MFPTSQTGLRTVVGLAFAGTVGLLIAHAVRYQSTTYAWFGPGGNPQHTNISQNNAVGLGRVVWSAPVDLFANSSGSVHYSGPAITAKNTVVFGVKIHQSNDFRMEARNGKTGAATWIKTTDYTVPPTSTTYWTGIFPIALCVNSVVAAGSGGTVFIKTDADDKNSGVTRSCFYMPIETFDLNRTLYRGIKINTQIMGGPAGTFYFGYSVFEAPPAAIAAKLGTGGIVQMTLAGTKTFKKASDLVPSSPGDVVRPAFNSGAVRSLDGKSVYIPITNVSRGTNYLVKLNASSLALQASVRLIDPNNGGDTWICPCSSASPVIGPDGHVFFGTLRNNDGTSHGWMLQFDANLSQTDANNVRYPVGAFGWDDTPSIVPANIVPSYKGTSAYLLMTKYNNYKGTGGDGRNRLAVLDPGKDNVTIDPISGKHVMNEVITVLGVTCDDGFYACTSTTDVNDPSVPVREWCINSAAIDRASKSAIVNSEDGHGYRWDFTTNTLKQGTYLQPGSLEPYTPTAIGADGTSYIINGGYIHAVRNVVTP